MKNPTNSYVVSFRDKEITVNEKRIPIHSSQAGTHSKFGDEFFRDSDFVEVILPTKIFDLLIEMLEERAKQKAAKTQDTALLSQMADLVRQRMGQPRRGK